MRKKPTKKSTEPLPALGKHNFHTAVPKAESPPHRGFDVMEIKKLNKILSIAEKYAFEPLRKPLSSLYRNNMTKAPSEIADKSSEDLGISVRSSGLISMKK